MLLDLWPLLTGDQQEAVAPRFIRSPLRAHTRTSLRHRLSPTLSSAPASQATTRMRIVANVLNRPGIRTTSAIDIAIDVVIGSSPRVFDDHEALLLLIGAP